MSTSKHEKTEGEGPFTSDLERNPGIGQSAGMQSPEDADLLEADNTMEGDVENGTGPNGEVREGEFGRTNK